MAGLPRGRLANLLGLYRQGPCAPLRFFPKQAAWASVKNSDNARKAMERWAGGMHAEYVEGNDPPWRFALRRVNESLDETFFTLAEKLFAPLVESILDERLSWLLGKCAGRSADRIAARLSAALTQQACAADLFLQAHEKYNKNKVAQLLL